MNRRREARAYSKKWGERAECAAKFGFRISVSQVQNLSALWFANAVPRFQRLAGP